MYGRGTVGGAELDMWNQWEAYASIDTCPMEPGRALTVCGVSLTSVGEKDSIEHLLCLGCICKRSRYMYTVVCLCVYVRVSAQR